MARITVEDCVDKVANRFELVLLAAHRARTIAKGSAAFVDPSDDKNTVIALREVAEKVMSTSDMREGFIESLQENTEVDEPEPAAAPALPPEFQPPRLGRDIPSLETQIDVMTEDALLRAMKSLLPQEPLPPEICLRASRRLSQARLATYKNSPWPELELRQALSGQDVTALRRERVQSSLEKRCCPTATRHGRCACRNNC